MFFITSYDVSIFHLKKYTSFIFSVGISVSLILVINISSSPVSNITFTTLNFNSCPNLAGFSSSFILFNRLFVIFTVIISSFVFISLISFAYTVLFTLNMYLQSLLFKYSNRPVLIYPLSNIYSILSFISIKFSWTYSICCFASSFSDVSYFVILLWIIISFKLSYSPEDCARAVPFSISCEYCIYPISFLIVSVLGISITLPSIPHGMRFVPGIVFIFIWLYIFFTYSGYLSIQSPTIKNVTFTLHLSNISNILSISSAFHAQLMVIATFLSCVSTE